MFYNFQLPSLPDTGFHTTEKDIRKHITLLWKKLERKKDPFIPGSSLLALPYPYIVPGGRFREIYYWDSYFTMLGLKESGEVEMMENMVKNFAYLLEKYGLIPNGNRSYYITRSQPPFFSMMVELLAGVQGKGIWKKYRGALQKELSYWKNECLTTAYNGIPLYYYQDQKPIPRHESYREDVITARDAVDHFYGINPFLNRDSIEVRCYQHLRAAAASGWDFSSRWLRQPKELSTIRTLDLIPVDLNCLMFHLENFSRFPDKTGNYARQKDKRSKQIKNVFFNDSLGWYCDFDLSTGRPAQTATLAGMFPMFMKLASKEDVPRIVAFLEKNFLKDGGVVTSLLETGQQWDSPNGWAPLQWITIIGLENYGYHELAKKIAEKWCRLNKDVFDRNGKLVEKYNVVDLTKKAGGGEYPSQDGFGWTNGVLLALLNKYGFR